LKPQNLLVVCDDLDLELGRLKIRAGGSSAGHKGMDSVIEGLGTDKFNRLRIGIGRPKDKTQISDFVLSKFNQRELETVDSVVLKAVDCCRDWLKYGIIKCMAKYNIRGLIR
ncbi:MAG: aminoacyl-tRNA hydrolase, partial [Candidatus Omnitrophica bacterium]|nr:aminoacyl-tRNA hydrolase [Candidatus Omnitrophota bacterium]